MSLMTVQTTLLHSKKVVHSGLVVLGVVGAMLFSGGVALAADSPFTCNIPSVGSITCGGNWTTTGGIPIQLFFENIQYYTYAKAIRCSDNSDISAYTGFDPGIDRLTWKPITPIQPAGICFKLNMNAPTSSSFAVSGKVRY